MILFEDIITQNEKMLENVEKARIYCDKNVPVLIYGETGTGKELFAQSLHYEGNRKSKPFIAQNCANIGEGIFESVMWGVERGAFTGAVEGVGLFETADKGTLFIDEINSLPQHLQAKLLRVIENQKVVRVGGTRPHMVDVRLIFAMNDTPENVIKNNIIRTDLFFRLSEYSLRMIPLRDRKDDIPLYVEYCIQKYNRENNKCIRGVTDELYEMMFDYQWPGNVRELMHYISFACTGCSSELIGEDDMPDFFFDFYDDEKETVNVNTVEDISSKIGTNGKSYEELMLEYSEAVLRITLEKTNGNVSRAARMLKMPRQTLQHRLRKAGLDNQRN